MKASKKNIDLCGLRCLHVLLGMLLSSGLWAQQVSPSLLFNDYHANAFQEKVFLHVNKTNFIAGETIFFRIFAVDGIDHKPVNLSRVCFIEIISQGNFPIAQLKVPLEHGKGYGSFDLPDTLNSGNYQVIGYTSWMKNFDPDYYFAQTVTILNPLEPTKAVSPTGPAVAIRFFPEGGNLVAGLPCRVAFHAVDRNGTGIEFGGYLLNDTNDTLLTFKPQLHGLGSFHFTPENGRTYRTYIRWNGGSLSHPLPSAEPNGMAIQLTQEKDDLTLVVRTNETEMRNQDISLFIHSRARGKKTSTARVNEHGEAVFTIKKTDLLDGITHFTIFDANQRPRAERLYFKRPKKLLKIEAKQLSSSLGKRSPISVDISTTRYDGKPVEADLSMSVFRVDEIQHYNSEDIVNFLLLTSDLKGHVENPFHYLSGNEGELEGDVDLLMLTHGWSRFRWEDVLQAKYPAIRFNPDYEGQNVQVKVTDDNDVPIPKAFVFLSVPSKTPQLYSAQSNATGILNFHAKEISGRSEIILQHLGTAPQKYVYNLMSPFTKIYPARSLPTLTLAQSHQDLISLYSVHQQVASTFNPPGVYTRTAKPSLSMFGRADKTYLMSDFVKFPVLEDVLREYVVEVIVRRREKKTNIYVLEKETQLFFENDPLILVDGVPVFDTERIVNLPAQYFEKVDIVMKKFYFGIFSFNGIVSFSTSDGLGNAGKVNPEAVVLDYDGLIIPREFYQPVYNGVSPISSRQPDFRNVLFWKPDVTTDSHGSASVTFSTSDLAGKYIGVVQGITSDGLPGGSTFSFEVGPPK